MQLIHGIDLRNWHPCHNLLLNGCLCTPNAMALIDSGIAEQHQPIDNTPIEDLAKGMHPPTVIAPRAIGEVIRAGILRRGKRLRMDSMRLSKHRKKHSRLHLIALM